MSVRIPPCPLELRGFPPPFHRPLGHSLATTELRIEAVMTRKTQPWGQQRGWIVPADGSPPQKLPRHMLGHKLISGPGTMPEKQPAEPVKYLASKDYYHRHVLNPEGVY